MDIVSLRASLDHVEDVFWFEHILPPALRAFKAENWVTVTFPAPTRPRDFPSHICAPRVYVFFPFSDTALISITLRLRFHKDRQRKFFNRIRMGRKDS
jgi:hypothetical protein